MCHLKWLVEPGDGPPFVGPAAAMRVNAIFNSNGRGAISKHLFRPITDKGYSAKFAFWGFHEVRGSKFPHSSGASTYRDGPTRGQLCQSAPRWLHSRGEDVAAACHIRLASGVSMFRTTDKGEADE